MSDHARYLEECRQHFLAATNGLTDEQAKTRPASDRWSVIECVEHVALVEDRFLGVLDDARRLDAPATNKDNELSLRGRLSNRVTKFEAPDVVQPAGRHTTLADAIAAFNAVRDRSVRFATEREGDLYWISVQHPRFGTMSGGELLTLLDAHARRHADQIDEARQAIGHPADA